MRSPIGPALIILSLATAVILVLVLLQTTGLRGDLDRARAEVVTLREQVETFERGVPMSELSMRLAELDPRHLQFFQPLCESNEERNGIGVLDALRVDVR